MRNIIKSILLALLVLLSPNFIHASKQALMAKKSGEIRIKDVSPHKTLTLIYNYGEMELVFWDKNEILLKYNECVRASSQKRADEIIQKRIAIESIEGCYFKVGKVDDSSVSFNSKWTVYIPSHIRSVAASNSFGNITVGKGFPGLIRIDVKNGDVSIPESKAMCVVGVTHGNFYVGNAAYLNMTTKHANGTIAFAQTLKVQAEHADFYKIDKADVMTINSKHSKIKVGNVGQLSSQGSYSTLEVNELSGLANIRDMQHSTIEMGEFLGKLDATDLSYSKLNITISKYNHTPVIMVTDLDYTDVKVKLPASLRTSTYVNGKGACKSTSSGTAKIKSSAPRHKHSMHADASSGTAKIKSSAPWSSPNGISTHVFQNTESFTPNSLIDINNESYGTILIEEY